MFFLAVRAVAFSAIDRLSWESACRFLLLPNLSALRAVHHAQIYGVLEWTYRQFVVTNQCLPWHGDMLQNQKAVPQL